MKTGITLAELSDQVQENQQEKKDFIVPTQMLRVHTNGSTVMEVPERGEWSLTDLAHSQLSTHLGVRKDYYDRLRSEPIYHQERGPDGSTNNIPLLDVTVNALLRARPLNERRMVRTLRDNARAFLSDRFNNHFDNEVAFGSVFNAIADLNTDIVPESFALTEQRMYMKFTFPKIQGEVKVGDVVQAGVVVSNSEVGLGNIQIEPLLLRLACINGMIISDMSVKRRHVGRRVQDDDLSNYEVYSNRTQQLDIAAFSAKITDTVKAVANETSFKSIVSRMAAAADRKIEAEPMKVIDATVNNFKLPENIGDILKFRFAEGRDYTQWGLANALTRVSQDVEGYDLATDLERFGGKVIDLTPSEWRAMNAK